MSKLVIFDLDDTLLCADSEFHFTKYIVKQGMLDKDFYLEKIKAFDKEYRSGNLNFNDYMRFLLYPLIGKTKKEVDLLVTSFINSSKDILIDDLTFELLEKHKKDDLLRQTQKMTSEEVIEAYARLNLYQKAGLLRLLLRDVIFENKTEQLSGLQYTDIDVDGAIIVARSSD